MSAYGHHEGAISLEERALFPMTDNTQSDVVEAQNTDREVWREVEGDYYADSIHVTKQGAIGINCGGTVHVMPVREWHALASTKDSDEAAYECGDHGKPLCAACSLPIEHLTQEPGCGAPLSTKDSHAVLEERERCARIADREGIKASTGQSAYAQGRLAASDEIAAAIRKGDNA